MSQTPKPIFMPLYWNDLLSDNKVRSMSLSEFGAYIKLLGAAWFEDPPGSLPDDDIILARLIGIGLSEWQQMRSAVMSPFKLGQDCRWHQKRMRQEYSNVQKRRAQLAEAGKKGARLRWDGSGNGGVNGDAIAEPIAQPCQGHSLNDSIQSQSVLSLSPKRPSREEFVNACKMRGMPDFWANDAYDALEEKDWMGVGQNWMARVNRVRTWWEEAGRPMRPEDRKNFRNQNPNANRQGSSSRSTDRNAGTYNNSDDYSNTQTGI